MVDRNHLAAIRASAPTRKRYCHWQDRPLNGLAMMAFLKHLLRELSGRMVVIRDGAPTHRRQVIEEFLANGATR
jgi:hypothetical protein